MDVDGYLGFKLKELNEFIAPCHLKMENIKMVNDRIKINDLFVKLDLKDAY